MLSFIFVKAVLYFDWFLNVPRNFCFLDSIKFILQAFPNQGFFFFFFFEISKDLVFLFQFIYFSNNNVINANCLSFDDPFLASKKNSQGVISRI